MLLSCVWVFVTPWTVAHQAPLSKRFSRQEYWNGLPKALFWIKVLVNWGLTLFLLMCVYVCSVAQSVSDSLQTHRLEPTRLLCPQDSPGKKTAVAYRLILPAAAWSAHCRTGQIWEFLGLDNRLEWGDRAQRLWIFKFLKHWCQRISAQREKRTGESQPSFQNKQIWI